MKTIYCTLFFLLVGHALYAQQQHLFTLTEMKQLATCPDQDCFRKAIQARGYRYRKEDSKITDSTALYAYFNRQMEPYRAEAFIIQGDLGQHGRRSIFSTNNKAFAAQLEADIQRSGYILSGQSDPSETRIYTLQEGTTTWILRREKPSFSRVSENFIITLYSVLQPVSVLAEPKTPGSAASEIPKLGGDWDARYPPQNTTDILKAERQYTADYERKHGNVGHTFSRVEKMRIQARRTGRYRPLTNERWNESFDLPLRKSGFDAFANDRVKLFQQEAQFDLNKELIWLPIQEGLIKQLEKEAKVGQVVTLYAVLVSHHDYGGQLHLSFLVNEFAATLATNRLEITAESTNTNKQTAFNTQQVEQGISATQKKAISKTTQTPSLNKVSSISCGFNWTGWASLPAAEKAAMKRVMVPDPEGGHLGSLLNYILRETQKGYKIQIARYDFYQKRQPGYLVYFEHPSPTDSDKGRIEVYEDFGESYLFPHATVKENLCAFRPADDNKGIINENGQVEALTDISLYFREAYTRFLTDTKQPIAPVALSTSVSTNKLGAKTPEELAILLLKCLKTNDKTTWMRCMHPDDSVEDDALSAQKFDRHMESLMAQGITNWPSVQYSRLTYPLRPMGGSKIDPNKTIPFSTVEFTYQNNEFAGSIKMGTFSFYEGRWLVWFSGFPEDCSMMRQPRR